MKIEDKLNEYLVKSGKEKNISNSLEKNYDIKVKKIEVEKVTTFFLKDGIDENAIGNFGLIDDIYDMLKKFYPKALITHDYDQFIVKEL